MAELGRLGRDLHAALGGEGFRRRRRIAVPLLTTDAGGFPRVALLTLGEVRVNSVSDFAVAVRVGSRTEANLVRRPTATLLYMHRAITAYVQARAGRGRVSEADAARHLFPLTVEGVRLDRPAPEEGRVTLLSGPMFGGPDASGLFSEELFEELGKVRPGLP